MLLLIEPAMIKRIVKMSFKPQYVDDFIEIFDHAHPLIENMPGCKKVELYAEDGKPNVLFTLSIWDNTESLKSYRNSELFKTTWEKTKALFDDKPAAWSINILR